MKIKPSKTLKPANQKLNTPIYTEILNMRNVRKFDFSKNNIRVNFFSKNNIRANFVDIRFLVPLILLVLLILLAFKVTLVNINIENNVAIKDFVQQNQDTTSAQLK